MTELWVERTGIRRYTGRSSRGAEVLIGSETDDGVFTPGELLKIALAGCSGLSSDHPLRRRLGDDYPAVIRVSGPADRERRELAVLLGSLGRFAEGADVLEGTGDAQDRRTADRLRARLN